MKKAFLLFVALCSTLLALGQSEADWAAQATDALIRHFWNPKEGYFNYHPDGLSSEFQYWPQAHAMDCVVDAYLRTGDKRYSKLFKPWLKGIKQKNHSQENQKDGSKGGYWNPYNDDMEWISLTMLRIYNINRDKRFLRAAQQMWGWISAQWNTEFADGGFAWRCDMPWSKNACGNAPGGLLAARLYAITKQASDHELAKRAFDWQLSHLIDAEGGVMDNIDGRSGKMGTFVLTYNQGTWIGLATELYRLTGEKRYLDAAIQAADYGTSTDSQMANRTLGILRDEGKGDGAQFKGIFMRYLALLCQQSDLPSEARDRYTAFIRKNCEVLWQQGTNPDTMLSGHDWSQCPQHPEEVQLTQQSSAAMTMEMAALLHAVNP